MALSSYDSVIVNEKGETVQQYKFPNGVVVGVRKDWIFIEDEKAWTEKESFMQPVVATVNEGSLTYRGIQVLAVRFPRTIRSGEHSVKHGAQLLAFAAWRHDHTKDQDAGIMGFTGYGYEDDTHYGIRPEDIAAGLRRLLYEANERAASLPVTFLALGFQAQVNQGDAYFAKHLGGSEKDVRQPVGQAGETILSKLVLGEAMGEEAVKKVARGLSYKFPGVVDDARLKRQAKGKVAVVKKGRKGRGK